MSSLPAQVDIIINLEQSTDPQQLRAALAKALNIEAQRIVDWRILKRSIDSRQRQIKLQLRLQVGIDAALPPLEPIKIEYARIPSQATRVIIVGCGPAGLFAALRLIQSGIQPIIVERGKDVSARRYDLAPIMREGRVIEDSNYCFGEGGAGTFSDGKLYTRATKRGPVRDVYNTFVAHGAPEQILEDAHPHIGSNLLPNVVRNMRNSIIAAGGEVHFGSKVVDLLFDENNKSRLAGVELADGTQLLAAAVILATGHSARDIYELFVKKNLQLQQKPFAVGVRIEHAQQVIDECQYHLADGQKRGDLLPAARYSVATKIDNRGVHSFCMCPGGFIVPAATQNDEVVVNGMSLSRRDSPFANSGLVVTVEPEDTVKFGKFGVLAGVAYQKHLEQAAKLHGGGGQVAPAQRVADFLKNTKSASLPETSYFPGINSCKLHEILPAGITKRMQQGLQLFARRMPKFIAEDALLIGFETRTSSPVRIPRDEQLLVHPQLTNLYPCGEGAGYAGGIVSAALDGLRCSEACIAALAKA